MREQNPLEVADEPHGEDQCLKLMRLTQDSIVMTFHQQSGRMRRDWGNCRCSGWIVGISFEVTDLAFPLNSRFTAYPEVGHIATQ
jgi:hypothetical protein